MTRTTETRKAETHDKQKTIKAKKPRREPEKLDRELT